MRHCGTIICYLKTVAHSSTFPLGTQPSQELLCSHLPAATFHEPTRLWTPVIGKSKVKYSWCLQYKKQQNIYKTFRNSIHLHKLNDLNASTWSLKGWAFYLLCGPVATQFDCFLCHLLRQTEVGESVHARFPKHDEKHYKMCSFNLRRDKPSRWVNS